MLQGLFVILACQLFGEAISHAAGLGVPGPVLGILFLLAFLSLRHERTKRDAAADDMPVGIAADGLLRILGLLFVPAGVGIVQSFHLVLANGPVILAALVGSTIVTLLVTVGTFRFVALRIARRSEREQVQP